MELLKVFQNIGGELFKILNGFAAGHDSGAQQENERTSEQATEPFHHPSLVAFGQEVY
jgi:hypothetical protein